MTNKEEAKILRGMVDFDFRKKKNTALSMGWTALRDIDEAKQRIIELADTIDKQNELIKKYQKALDIAADEYRQAAMCSKNFCPRYDKCCVILSDDSSRWSMNEEECRKFALESWKKEAGIEC